MIDDISGWKQWFDAFCDIPEFNSPSELHGLLTGLVCVVQPPTAQEWEQILAQLGVEIDMTQHLQLLTEEAEDVAALLLEEDLDFQPLLPDDEHILIERVGSLSDWCEGVLLGFGLAGGIVRVDEQELIKDLSFIAALNYDENEEPNAEQSEAGYAELVEFARLIPCSLSMGRTKQSVKSTAMMTVPVRNDVKAMPKPSVVEHFKP